MSCTRKHLSEFFFTNVFFIFPHEQGFYRGHSRLNEGPNGPCPQLISHAGVFWLNGRISLKRSSFMTFRFEGGF